MQLSKFNKNIEFSYVASNWATLVWLFWCLHITNRTL